MTGVHRTIKRTNKQRKEPRGAHASIAKHINGTAITTRSAALLHCNLSAMAQTNYDDTEFLRSHTHRTHRTHTRQYMNLSISLNVRTPRVPTARQSSRASTPRSTTANFMLETSCFWLKREWLVVCHPEQPCAEGSEYELSEPSSLHMPAPKAGELA